MIAGTLKGIVSQRLVKTADGQGRVACCEIMVMTGRVHDMILDPKLTGQLPEVVAEGGYYGMQTFDQHLLKHLQAGRITLRRGDARRDLAARLQADGRGRGPDADRAAGRRRCGRGSRRAADAGHHPPRRAERARRRRRRRRQAYGFSARSSSAGLRLALMQTTLAQFNETADRRTPSRCRTRSC